MHFSVHSYAVAREICALVGHVAHEEADTFEGRCYLTMHCIFCKGKLTER
jgi:hypothetical protein